MSFSDTAHMSPLERQRILEFIIDDLKTEQKAIHANQQSKGY